MSAPTCNSPGATVDAYCQAWNRMDFDALEALWDPDADEIYYLAEENERPLYQLSEVRDYFKTTARVVTQVSMWLANERYKSLGHQWTVASFDMHVDCAMAAPARPIGVDVRVSAILQNNGGAWQFIHYAEAPLGTLPFIRQVYNNNTRQI